MFVDRFLSKREEFQRRLTITLESRLNHTLKLARPRRLSFMVRQLRRGPGKTPYDLAIHRNEKGLCIQFRELSNVNLEVDQWRCK